MYPSSTFRTQYLSSYGRDISAAPGGTIEVIEADEAISIGRIIQRQAFDVIAAYQYAVIQVEDD